MAAIELKKPTSAKKIAALEKEMARLEELACTRFFGWHL